MLHRNVSELDGQIFRQILRTAMGHAHGPFCCQCLHGLARAAAFMVTVHHGTLTPVFGKDLLMTVTLWFKGEQQLLDFMDWLNHQHS